MNAIVGSIVALVTPMHEDGSIDYDALRRLVDWHVAEGTACIGAASKSFTWYPVITLPAKRPMPGKSREPATSRVWAVAGVGTDSRRGRRRISGLVISRKGAIENPCKF